jgi:hypothetical protein
VIIHFPPRLTKTGKASALDPEDLAHHSRAVHDPPGFDPGYLITSNYDAILDSALFRGNTNNGNNGTLFEICFWNALIKYGIDPAKIERHVDPTHGKNADIDFLVHAPLGDVALLLKTSLRERWKQLDRDANAIRFTDSGGRLEVWAVFYREHRDDTPVKMIRLAENKERMFFTGGVRVRTVLDGNAMRALFTRCGGVVENAMFSTPSEVLL